MHVDYNIQDPASLQKVCISTRLYTTEEEDSQMKDDDISDLIDGVGAYVGIFLISLLMAGVAFAIMLYIYVSVDDKSGILLIFAVLTPVVVFILCWTSFTSQMNKVDKRDKVEDFDY